MLKSSKIGCLVTNKCVIPVDRIPKITDWLLWGETVEVLIPLIRVIREYKSSQLAIQEVAENWFVTRTIETWNGRIDSSTNNIRRMGMGAPNSRYFTDGAHSRQLQ